ncbi:hypothetical protein N7517_003395 [Penicillium concentricum]|uniref:Protein kinase domain-containing protein n=1 Tax=Penicillium concentricum TaxID=293559 RepID=A0A9W9SX48_9EURO|nr:uncharacterized protein N7517_003395 [Penicillium concentricum]KAJ5385484.1 hypothetical protein N7517_003395 [Penicillium concentricum]
MSTVEICSHLYLKHKNYSEDRKNDPSNDAELNKDPEPHIRWLTLIVRDCGCQWWIKIIVIGTLTHFRPPKEFRDRRDEFTQFARSIDYRSLPLLDDTLTQISLIISQGTHNIVRVRQGFEFQDNAYAAIAYKMNYEITEDPKRVFYPVCPSSSLRKIDVNQLQSKSEILGGVSKVLLENQAFVYKEINRPLYIPPWDTQCIMKELEVLTQFQGYPGIVQLAGIVICTNPYKTDPASERPKVVSGFLLEFWDLGSLEQILESGNIGKYFNWRARMVQIGEALIHMHESHRSHLDLKPSNIVMNSKGHAAIIDIGGSCGFTWEWLAPETVEDLLNQRLTSINALPFDMQVRNDCWAYGKVLLAVAEYLAGSVFGYQLMDVARGLTDESPDHRISLVNAIMLLRKMNGGESILNGHWLG